MLMLSVSMVTFMLGSHGQYSISRLGCVCQPADISQHVWLLANYWAKTLVQNFFFLLNKLLFFSRGQQWVAEV